MIPKWKRATQAQLNLIQEVFEQRGFNVTQRVDGNPDCDFIYGSNSRFFVSGGGGFSKLISAMVKIGNGTLLNQQYGKPIADKVKLASKQLREDSYQGAARTPQPP